jgi:hypothetical protein
MPPPRVVLSSQLTDTVHSRPVVQGLRTLANGVNDHDAQIQALIARVGAIKVPTIQQIKDALQTTGTNPLNPPFTPGGGGTTGGGTILYGTHGDRLALLTASVQRGTEFIETDRYALYEFTSTGWLFLGNILGPMQGTRLGPDTRPTDLGAMDTGFIFEAIDANGAWWQWSGSAWVFQIGTGVPIEVTLIPDTKPAVLGVNDVGFGIWSTDYHRFYLWTGAVWAEGEHNDARYQIGGFNAVPDQLGWFLCDGSTVKQSQSNATVADYTTPNLIGSNYFLRSNNVPGGTGGTATHVHSVDPPNTTSAVPVPNVTGGPAPNATGGPAPNATGTPSATVTVDNNGGGSTVNVATDTHTHDLGGHTHDLGAHTHDLSNHTHDVNIAAFDSAAAGTIPPYYDVVPYIRL